jgi:ubiquinone/menaquinone biosynthesis C-methylase UbiE
MDNSEEYVKLQKEETQKMWNSNPCGQVGDIFWSEEYFEEVERNRYETYATWMKGFYKYDQHKDIKLLEIGFGQGTDLIQYCKGGAECYGVDITENHYLLAKENFNLRGLKANLQLADASNLPFESETFDKAVSFGVLHHTPDVQKCVDEAHRVLKPGGTLVLSMYHRNSLYYWTGLLFMKGILKGELFRLGYAGLKSLIELGADGKKIKPYVKLYTRKSITELVKSYSTCKLDIRHLRRKDIFILGWLLPKSIIAKLEPYFGWYIIATCTK